MKKYVAGMARPWRRERRRGANITCSAGAVTPFLRGTEMQAPEPSAGESLLWLWGSGGFSALSKSKWTLFSWACRKPEKDLFYSEGGLPGSGISKCSTTASASVVLIQARQLRVSQWGLSVVQWLWELRMRIVGSCFVLLEWYSVGLQKSLPWDPDYMWYSFTYVYSKFLKTLTRENCPDVNYYSYIKIHIQKQFLF